MMTTMQAVTWSGTEQLSLVRMERPQLQAHTDAIVQVSHASTCGTDVHIYRGAVPGFEPGTVIGHEFVGTVVETGTAVQRVRRGQRVRCGDFTACGGCGQCSARRYAQCSARRMFGFSGIQARLDGGMAEFVRIPAADTVLDPLPATVDARAGLLAADVLPTALGALARASLLAGERLAIVGAGPVGVLAAWLATQDGVSVTLLETSPDRAARARQAGLQVCAVSVETTLEQSLQESFDAVIDAVGGERGLAAALTLVRPRGRVVGAGSQAAAYAVNWAQLFQREISLHFVIGDTIALRPWLGAAMQACEPVLDLMFSDHLHLDEVPGYFALLHAKKRFKAVVSIGAAGTEP